MISKEDFKKINDYLWEHPKTGQMNVPARIYVSEKMLDEVFKDKSVEQLINTATLPGIVNYSMAMPDIHEGYGFPIGGVAAMDKDTGVISPGGVGYDINCLHPNSVVNLEFGTHFLIKDLRNNLLPVTLINKKSRNLINSKIIRFLFRKEDKFVYKIKTKSGYELMVTEDHPLYTIEEEMKEAKNLKIGDKLISYPFKGVLYEKLENKELINEKKLINTLIKLGFKNNGNRYPQIIKWFKQRNFINLNTNSWQIPYLIKVIGYIFGDGTVNLIGKDRNGVASFYGKIEDLSLIESDLKKINIDSKIYTRERHHRVRNAYNKIYEFSVVENHLKVASTSFAVLLYILGVPFGNKTNQEFRIPRWILNMPKWQKRLFLASFFGAELSKPATLNKYNFYAPTLNINKIIPLKNNGIDFLKEIKLLLKTFDVKTSTINESEKLGNKGKTIGLRFHIDGATRNLIKFFETVGFEYNIEKQKLGCLATAYLRRKELIKESRNKIRVLVRNLYSQGTPARILVNEYKNEFTGKRFIEHSIWSERGEPRIAFNFLSFKEFAEKYAYGNSGLVIDEIEEIEKENYNGLVYDLTINSPDHNFIANNFVVSNCGMKLLKSELNEQEIKLYLDKLATEIQKEVPSGLGRGRQIKLSIDSLDKILKGGAKKLVEQGYGEENDIKNCESNGFIEQADPDAVSFHAKNRGRDQVGTLGSGNHFLEIQKVDEIFDENTAKKFGLFKNQVVMMIHTGSRGLGHQIATDYIQVMMRAMGKYNISLPDRELACAPFKSSEGQRYFSAMSAGANYAWANRQMIAHYIRKAWREVLGEKTKLTAIYDVAHNIAKLEKYEVDNKEKELVVHRKGATRAFPDQPVLIPGSMGTASYVLVGTEQGKDSWYSTCHGAGRTMSRHAATRALSGQEIINQLKAKGILVKCYSMRGIAEEAPQAYKNIDEVVEVVHQAGLSKKVARLVPLAVIKGE